MKIRPAPSRRKVTFSAVNREQFEKTIAAGLKPVALHSPFLKRTDARTGKVRQMGKAPRDHNWPTMSYESDIVLSDCMSHVWNMGYRIDDGVGALDVDERSGGVESLKKLCKKFPSFKPENYPRSISGGNTGAGGHLLFKIPKGVKLKNSLASDGYPGLEPVCVGRQLVSPGSIHPDTGRMYVWDESHADIEDGLPELPSDVLAFLTRKKRARAEHPDAGRYTCEQVERMMRGLDPTKFRDYHDWIKIGMAIHYSTDGAGDEVWREWSAQDEEYGAGDEEIQAKWDSFGTDKADPVTHLHLLKLLHTAGNGRLIPILEGETISPEYDFPDQADEATPDEDAWLEGLGPLDDLALRAKDDPAAPFGSEALAALAKLKPHDLQKILADLKKAGFKNATALTQAIKKATPKKPAKKKNATASSVLQRIVGSECDISLQSDGTVFASYVREGIVRCVNVTSKEFDEWLAYRLFKVMGVAPSKPTLDELKRVVTATAKHENAPTLPSFRRVARLDGAIYLDLCNDKREAVEITSDGWRVIASDELPDGFRFVRSAGMQPLPTPAAPEDGDVTLLRELFTLKPDIEGKPSVNDTGFVLLVSWLLMTFTRGPFPILVIDGGAGTAKSTTCDLVRAVVDPSFAPGRSMPASELDLFVTAQGSHVQQFDNLSNIPQWFSDALCRLATGGGLSKRELFTDAEEILMKARNPVLMNGLHSDMMSRNDLLDRALIVTLAKIEQKKTEERVRSDFAGGHPVALAGLLSMVAHGLRNLAFVPEEGAQTRLADFERWLNACESYLWTPGTFQRVFMGMRATAKAKLLRHAPVSRALLSFMETREEWTGTASELNQALYVIHDLATTAEGTPTAPEQRWPGAPHIFSRRLRDAQGMLLEAFNITIDFVESDDRVIKIGRELDFG